MTSEVGREKKLKIVCLHGYGTNKEFMRMQTEIFRRDLEPMAEFIFIDGPAEIPLDTINDPKVLKNLVGKPYSWYNSRNRHKTTKIEDALIEIDKVRITMEEASDYYDGAMCFSQGSFMFQWLLWYQAKGLIDWPIIRNMKFFINFSADSFRINMKSLDYKRFEIPSIHFLSEEDFLFNRCIIAPTLFESPEVVYHSFGHRFPVLGVTEKQQLRSFLKKHGHGSRKVRGIQAESRL